MSEAAPNDLSHCVQAEAEAEMIEEARKSPQAFGPLYDLYYSKILGYIFRRTLDAEVAEELTSNTFFHALRALQSYDHRGQFSAWLYRIATNEISRYRRTASRRGEFTGRGQIDLDRICFDSSMHEPEDPEEILQAFTRLHEAVERLPEKYQVAISLRYFEALSNAEVAEILGKRLGTVKSLIHRGLKLLSGQYQHQLQEEGHRP